MWAFFKSSSCFVDTVTNLGIAIHKLKRGSEPRVLKAVMPLKVTQWEREATPLCSQVHGCFTIPSSWIKIVMFIDCQNKYVKDIRRWTSGYYNAHCLSSGSTWNPEVNDRWGHSHPLGSVTQRQAEH